MEPNDIAMKFASASSTCKNGKCPFSSECRGTSDTCKMKEVAMVIRSLVAENTVLKSKLNAISGISDIALSYIADVERVNEYYYRTCSAFQRGYKPKTKITRKNPRTYRKRKPKDPVKMDGDEHYAYDEPKQKSEPQIVII